MNRRSSNARATSDRVVCRTPTPGKQPVRIDAWKFELMRERILAALPSKEPGIAFKELPKLVEESLSSDQRKRLGSVGWYTTVVKLELEVAGEIVRVEGARPQRLLRNGGARR